MSNNNDPQTTKLDCTTEGNPPTIKMECAIRWIADWIETHQGDTRAFLIPITDLFAAMVEMGMVQKDGDCYKVTIEENKLRAYMALDFSEPDPCKQQKLLIVGTQKEEINGGEIIYRDIVQDEKNPMYPPDVLEGSGIFDFTTPCPTACDSDSPLNQ